MVWKFSMSLFFLTWWEDGSYCLSFILFGHENGSSEFLRKIISNMADSCKNIQKLKILQQQEAKRVKHYYTDFLMNTHSSLPSPSPTTFLKEGNEISTKLSRASSFFKNICMGNQNREGRRNAKAIGRCDVTIIYDGN